MVSTVNTFIFGYLENYLLHYHNTSAYFSVMEQSI